MALLGLLVPFFIFFESYGRGTEISGSGLWKFSIFLMVILSTSTYWILLDRNNTQQARYGTVLRQSAG